MKERNAPRERLGTGGKQRDSEKGEEELESTVQVKRKLIQVRGENVVFGGGF